MKLGLVIYVSCMGVGFVKKSRLVLNRVSKSATVARTCVSARPRTSQTRKLYFPRGPKEAWPICFYLTRLCLPAAFKLWYRFSMVCEALVH